MTFDIDKAISERFEKGAPLVADPDRPGVYMDSFKKPSEILDDQAYQDLKAGQDISWMPYRSKLFSALSDRETKLDPRKEAVLQKVYSYDNFGKFIQGLLESGVLSDEEYELVREALIPSIVEDVVKKDYTNFDNNVVDKHDTEDAAKKITDKKSKKEGGTEGESVKEKQKAEAEWRKEQDEKSKGTLSEGHWTDTNSREKESTVKNRFEDDTGASKPFTLSFDIGARMAQWDAAGRSQHVEDTETILRGGNPYVEGKRGREDFKDPENVFQFMEWAFGPFDYGRDEGYLRLKSALENNPELARSLMAAIEQTTLQTEDFRGRGDSMAVPGKYQNPEDGMNRIGADKPRQEAWDEISFSYPEPDGEGGYYSEEATVDEDVTEEKPGPTSRAKAAAEKIKGDSKAE